MHNKGAVQRASFFCYRKVDMRIELKYEIVDTTYVIKMDYLNKGSG